MAAVLCVWMVLAAAGIYPDHLAYFNEAACLPHDPGRIGLDGGAGCGTQWLDDSNVDWGQGLKQLKLWMERHAKARPVRLAAFGSFPASAYGFPVTEIGMEDLPSSPQPGLWAVSAHFIARAPPQWLRTTRPAAIVGHSIYVFDIVGATRTQP